MSRAAGFRSGGGSVGMASPRRPAASTNLPLTYLERSQNPLTCLLFLLPLLVAYEVGTHLFVTDVRHHTEQRILAFQFMQMFFHWFGASGKYLPPAAIVAVLVSWHVARKDSWELDFATAGLIALESVAWSLPLRVFDALANQYVPLMATTGKVPSLLVLSIGAGIYEEVVFRLALFVLLTILLVDVLRLPRKPALLLMVVSSALAFAGYHYLGSEPFQWRTFAFRTGAGVYFSFLFFWRGFGVTAGSHAAYDILAVSLGACAG